MNHKKSLIQVITTVVYTALWTPTWVQRTKVGTRMSVTRVWSVHLHSPCGHTSLQSTTGRRHKGLSHRPKLLPESPSRGARINGIIQVFTCTQVIKLQFLMRFSSCAKRAEEPRNRYIRFAVHLSCPMEFCLATRGAPILHSNKAWSRNLTVQRDRGVRGKNGCGLARQ